MPVKCHSYIGEHIIKITPQEKLLKEYGHFLDISAKHYTKRGVEYHEAYNQLYLFLLENYQKYKSPEELKYYARNQMRNYFRKELKEREAILYGTDSENINK